MKNLTFDEHNLFYEKFEILRIWKNILFLAFIIGSHECTTSSSSISEAYWMPDLPVVINPLPVVLGSGLASRSLSTGSAQSTTGSEYFDLVSGSLSTGSAQSTTNSEYVDIVSRILSTDSAQSNIGSECSGFASKVLSTGRAQGYNR